MINYYVHEWPRKLLPAMGQQFMRRGSVSLWIVGETLNGAQVHIIDEHWTICMSYSDFRVSPFNYVQRLADEYEARIAFLEQKIMEQQNPVSLTCYTD